MKKKKILLLFLVILAMGLVSCKAKDLDLNRTEFYMNTVMNIKFTGQEETMKKAFNRIEDIENRMSSKMVGTEIDLINKNAGIEPVEVSEDTYLVLERALEYAENSNGVYDPTIGPLIDLWDIMGGYENRNWIPSEEDIKSAQKLVDYKKLKLMDGNKVFLEEVGMKIDLGSIVKGYAADEAKRALEEDKVEFGLINLGGDVFAYGEKADKSPWKVGVQDPHEPTGNPLGVSHVKNKSIVTSGDYERYFEIDGKRYHHIIDISTGYPSENELMSATIISDKSIDGDAISTTVFIMGVEKGMEFVKSIDGVDAIFITKDNRIVISENSEWEFNILDDSKGYKIEYK